MRLFSSELLSFFWNLSSVFVCLLCSFLIIALKSAAFSRNWLFCISMSILANESFSISSLRSLIYTKFCLFISTISLFKPSIYSWRANLSSLDSFWNDSSCSYWRILSISSYWNNSFMESKLSYITSSNLSFCNLSEAKVTSATFSAMLEVYLMIGFSGLGAANLCFASFSTKVCLSSYITVEVAVASCFLWLGIVYSSISISIFSGSLLITKYYNELTYFSPHF